MFPSSGGSNISRVRIGVIFLPIAMLIFASWVRLFGADGSRFENCAQVIGKKFGSTLGHTPISVGSESRTRLAVVRSSGLFPTIPTTRLEAPESWQESSSQPSASRPAFLRVRTKAIPSAESSLNSVGLYGLPSLNTYISTFMPLSPASFFTTSVDCCAVNCLGPKISMMRFTSAIRLVSVDDNWSCNCPSFAASSSPCFRVSSFCLTIVSLVVSASQRAAIAATASPAIIQRFQKSTARVNWIRRSVRAGISGLFGWPWESITLAIVITCCIGMIVIVCLPDRCFYSKNCTPKTS